MPRTPLSDISVNRAVNQELLDVTKARIYGGSRAGQGVAELSKLEALP